MLEYCCNMIITKNEVFIINILSKLFILKFPNIRNCRIASLKFQILYNLSMK